MGAIPTTDECKPGIRATGFSVFVATEAVDDVTKGGIIIPDSARDKDIIVQTRGRIVSTGPVAFDFADFPDGTKPKTGDAIAFAKLAGVRFQGTDGRDYRAINDRDVFGIIEEAE